jgi:diguanylate cyclase (GGDEF)-like protein
MVFATKVGKLYPYLHLLLLGGCLFWYSLAKKTAGHEEYILSTLLVYAAVVLLLGWSGRHKYVRLSNLFFVYAVLDAAAVAMIIRFTGGFGSNFYLAFFPVVALASVVSVGWRGYVAALWYGACYFMAGYPLDGSAIDLQNFSLRLGSIWSVGLVSYAASKSMVSSETKLLSTLDVLNERTWELEKSQTQLSNIYETTRALSGILEMDKLLEAILDVAHSIFRLQKCQVYLTNVTADCLYLYGSLGNGNKRIFEKPPMHVRDTSPSMEVGDRTALFKQLNFGNRESGADFLDIPLVSRGKLIGIIRVVTEKGTMPTDRERHLLMIFSNSAAVAIDNSLLHKRTEELTITDALTELFNYRYFRNKLGDELRRADRYRQRFSLLMMDLDHFKKVNDVYGHQTGNIVLREVANVIRQCIRDVDIVARYGGEEFVVILPQTGDHDALTIAERMRSAIEKAYLPNAQGQRDVQITVSIGVASYPDGVHTLDQLLEKVDKALYQAKSDGRNRVHMAASTKKTPVQAEPLGTA